MTVIVKLFTCTIWMTLHLKTVVNHIICNMSLNKEKIDLFKFHMIGLKFCIFHLEVGKCVSNSQSLVYAHTAAVSFLH